MATTVPKTIHDSNNNHLQQQQQQQQPSQSLSYHRYEFPVLAEDPISLSLARSDPLACDVNNDAVLIWNDVIIRPHGHNDALPVISVPGGASIEDVFQELQSTVEAHALSSGVSVIHSSNSRMNIPKEECCRVSDRVDGDGRRDQTDHPNYENAVVARRRHYEQGMDFVLGSKSVVECDASEDNNYNDNKDDNDITVTNDSSASMLCFCERESPHHGGRSVCEDECYSNNIIRLSSESADMMMCRNCLKGKCVASPWVEPDEMELKTEEEKEEMRMRELYNIESGSSRDVARDFNSDQSCSCSYYRDSRPTHSAVLLTQEYYDKSDSNDNDNNNNNNNYNNNNYNNNNDNNNDRNSLYQSDQDDFRTGVGGGVGEAVDGSLDKSKFDSGNFEDMSMEMSPGRSSFSFTNGGNSCIGGCGGNDSALCYNFEHQKEMSNDRSFDDRWEEKGIDNVRYLDEQYNISLSVEDIANCSKVGNSRSGTTTRTSDFEAEDFSEVFIDEGGNEAVVGTTTNSSVSSHNNSRRPSSRNASSSSRRSKHRKKSRKHDVTERDGSWRDDASIVVQCANQSCASASSLVEARKSYKNCHHCLRTYYCSRQCRRQDWSRHKEGGTCHGSRVSSACKRVIRYCNSDPEVKTVLSRLAIRGYLSHGKGCVMLGFPDLECTEEFVEFGFPSLDLNPIYVSAKELSQSKMYGNVLESLVETCKSYQPVTKFVLNVGVGLPLSLHLHRHNYSYSNHQYCFYNQNHEEMDRLGSQGSDLGYGSLSNSINNMSSETISSPCRNSSSCSDNHCCFAFKNHNSHSHHSPRSTSSSKHKGPILQKFIKLRLSPLHAQHEHEQRWTFEEHFWDRYRTSGPTLILTGIPECTGDENESRKRELTFINIQRKLRQRNVSLRHQYPSVYANLVDYVTKGDRCPSQILFPVDTKTGRTFTCFMMPEAEAELEWMQSHHLLNDLELSKDSLNKSMSRSLSSSMPSLLSRSFQKSNTSIASSEGNAKPCKPIDTKRRSISLAELDSSQVLDKLCDPKSTMFDNSLTLCDPKSTMFDHSLTLCDPKSTMFDNSLTLCDPKSTMFDHSLTLCDPKSTMFDHSLTLEGDEQHKNKRIRSMSETETKIQDQTQVNDDSDDKISDKNVHSSGEVTKDIDINPLVEVQKRVLSPMQIQLDQCEPPSSQTMASNSNHRPDRASGAVFNGNSDGIQTKDGIMEAPDGATNEAVPCFYPVRKARNVKLYSHHRPPHSSSPPAQASPQQRQQQQQQQQHQEQQQPLQLLSPIRSMSVSTSPSSAAALSPAFYTSTPLTKTANPPVFEDDGLILTPSSSHLTQHSVIPSTPLLKQSKKSSSHFEYPRATTNHTAANNITMTSTPKQNGGVSSDGVTNHTEYGFDSSYRNKVIVDEADRMKRRRKDRKSKRVEYCWFDFENTTLDSPPLATSTLMRGGDDGHWPENDDRVKNSRRKNRQKRCWSFHENDGCNNGVNGDGGGDGGYCYLDSDAGFRDGDDNITPQCLGGVIPNNHVIEDYSYTDNCLTCDWMYNNDDGDGGGDKLVPRDSNSNSYSNSKIKTSDVEHRGVLLVSRADENGHHRGTSHVGLQNGQNPANFRRHNFNTNSPLFPKDSKKTTQLPASPHPSCYLNVVEHDDDAPDTKEKPHRSSSIARANSKYSKDGFIIINSKNRNIPSSSSQSQCQSQSTPWIVRTTTITARTDTATEQTDNLPPSSSSLRAQTNTQTAVYQNNSFHNYMSIPPLISNNSDNPQHNHPHLRMRILDDVTLTTPINGTLDEFQKSRSPPSTSKPEFNNNDIYNSPCFDDNAGGIRCSDYHKKSSALDTNTRRTPSVINPSFLALNHDIHHHRDSIQSDNHRHLTPHHPSSTTKLAWSSDW